LHLETSKSSYTTKRKKRCGMSQVQTNFTAADMIGAAKPSAPKKPVAPKATPKPVKVEKVVEPVVEAVVEPVVEAAPVVETPAEEAE
jgi:hypothetical protein